jgi:hypothetical protein
VGHERGIIPEAPPDLKPGDRDHFKGLAVIRRHRYEDEDGTHLQDMCRLDSDDPDLRFRPQLPTGEWKAAKKQVPYRLPQLLATPIGDLVVYPEGERDADTMVGLGFVATTHAGGVFKYPKRFNKYFKDRDIVICGDFDREHHKGEENAQQIAAELATVAKRVRVLIAPDGFKDMTEWVERGGGTREAFIKLVEALADFRPEQPKPQDPSELGPPLTIDQALDVFQRWLILPNLTPVYAVLGTVAANLLPGDPVWLGVIGPPSRAKTEILNSILLLPNIAQSATVTLAGLLSGTPKKQRDKTAKGGLLRQLGSFGIIMLKDFGSVLSMRPDAKAEVLGALREIYDGAWTRHLGTDGGQTLAWEGKIGLLFGATGVIDAHYSVLYPTHNALRASVRSRKTTKNLHCCSMAVGS